MATRSGNIDVTAAQSLQRGLGLSRGELQDYLNHQSGLLGISGSSSDVRDLLELEAGGDKKAKLALKMYTFKIQQAIGQMAASLGGVDALVFTGTVGERSAIIRQRVASRLMYLGLSVDPRINHNPDMGEDAAIISPARYPAKVYVIHADETSQMAASALQFAKK